MKVVARQAAVGGQVVPLRAGVAMPPVNTGALEARVAQLETHLAQLVKVHNATVEDFNKLKAQHAALVADHNKVRVGASSLAKHFQGLAGAAAQAGITYAPIQAQQRAPAAQAQQPRAAPPPASQSVVNAQPAAPSAGSGGVWEQRENLFYEGGEGEEG